MARQQLRKTAPAIEDDIIGKQQLQHPTGVFQECALLYTEPSIAEVPIYFCLETLISIINRICVAKQCACTMNMKFTA